MIRDRLPRPARWLLAARTFSPDTRAQVEADLHELFCERRRRRGALNAHWRLYRDVLSLWRRSGGSASSISGLVADACVDVKYAARLFARQPAILFLAIAGLSLGLGIATAAFSVMNAAALRGEGLIDPDRVPGVLRVTEGSTSTTWRYDEFRRLRDGATRMQLDAVLSESAPVRTAQDGADEPAAAVAFVTDRFFTSTGARMASGRSLDAAAEASDGVLPVVISHVFWTSRLNSEPAAIGRSIRVGRADAVVVGVAERGFSVPGARLLWMPMTAYGAVFSGVRTRRAPEAGIQVFGRLLPGATLAEAEAQLSGVAASFPLPVASRDSATRTRLDPGAGLGRMPASDTLAIAGFVFVVIGLVLVLACANVATVLVSTAMTREREIGVRAALGASRSRIVRQLVTESLLLGTIAAGVGLLLAHWALPVIGTLIEAPAGTDLVPDRTVHLFLGLVTLLTSIAAGLAPAWHGRGVDLLTPLKGGNSRPDRAAPRRLRSLLVGTQAAVSVLLIVLASLFVRATYRAATIDVGFDPAGLYTVTSGLGDGYDAGRGAAIRDFWNRVIPELQSVPGVSALSLAELTPFDGITRTAITGDSPSRLVHFNRTQPGYFQALGLRVLAGRSFTVDEVAARAPVALISESVARAYWPGGSAIGKLLPAAIPVTTLPDFGLTGTRPVIIGVVTDAITARLEERSTLAVYEPLDPANERFGTLVIRVAPDAPGAISLVNQRLRAIDPQAAVSIASVGDRLRAETRRPRMVAMLSGAVGLIAIVLCVVGLYGLTASVVAQRAREMAVRVAMGAETRDLLRLLIWDSLRPVVAGLGVGASVALIAGRAIGSTLLFGVSPQDPLAFAGATSALLAAALLAVLVPTRRGAAIDAWHVLRQS